MQKTVHRVPCIVNNEEIYLRQTSAQKISGNHGQALCEYSQATPEIVNQAIVGSLGARESWSRVPFHERAAIFLKAADLISNKYWPQLLAATMIGQGKNAWQAEVDAHAELVDFLRFNCKFASEIYEKGAGELTSPPGTWNRMDFRPLEGFVTAISPFNFTAIGGNLPTTPAIMGNVVVWKPSSSAVYSNYLIMKILVEAGLPPGVIQFLPGQPAPIVEALVNHPRFTGLHFTGSTGVFQDLWRRIAINLDRYGTFPRIVGETGGKNMHFVHHSANIDNVVNQTIRAAFEYQGQKCSACSRLYVPESVWPQIKTKLVEEVSQIRQGDVNDFGAFAGPVINRAAFDKISGYIKHVKQADKKEACIIAGGHFDDSIGFFIQPTVVLTSNPSFRTMTEEIFGPLLTVYVYPDAEYEQTLRMVNDASTYGLTAAVFATEREAIVKASNVLVNAAGNLYINDKCTGAVVGQQPFGGARKSGTNDKAGSALNLMRWTSPRTIKESFTELHDWRYPSNR